MVYGLVAGFSRFRSVLHCAGRAEGIAAMLSAMCWVLSVRDFGADGPQPTGADFSMGQRK